MTMEIIALVGFSLTVLVTGVAIGRFVEKIDRFISKKDDEEHKNTKK